MESRRQDEEEQKLEREKKWIDRKRGRKENGRKETEEKREIKETFTVKKRKEQRKVTLEIRDLRDKSDI